MYPEHEIKEIQDMIAGKRKLSDRERGILMNEFKDKQVPKYLGPFIKLFATNPDLYSKISQNKIVQKYSILGFFPETFDLFYSSEISPEVSYMRGNRGGVAIILHPIKNIVVKPTQNSREHEIVKIADELKVGPKQCKTLDGFLTEKFVEGDFFPELKGEKSSSDNMYMHGRRVGEVLSKLHSRDVYYNDVILTDDLGRSHLIVPKESPAILFDYGASLRLDNHPNPTDEEVYLFVRTLPVVNMFFECQPSQEKVETLMKEYRPKIQMATKQQIMARDFDFISEGLTFATYRLGGHIVDPFLKGFKETYL